MVFVRNGVCGAMVNMSLLRKNTVDTMDTTFFHSIVDILEGALEHSFYTQNADIQMK